MSTITAFAIGVFLTIGIGSALAALNDWLEHRADRHHVQARRRLEQLKDEELTLRYPRHAPHFPSQVRR